MAKTKYSAHQKRYIGYRVAKHFLEAYPDGELTMVGFDMSMTQSGYVVMQGQEIVDEGTFGTQAADGPMWSRIAHVAYSMQGLIEKHDPDVVCWEKISVGKNFLALKQLSMVLSCLYYTLNEYTDVMPLLMRVSPNTIKNVSGAGTSGGKSQILQQVLLHWDLVVDNDDIADAAMSTRFALVLPYVCKAFVEEMPGDTDTKAFSDALLDVYKGRHDVMERTFNTLVPDELNPEGVDMLSTILTTLRGKSGLNLLKLNSRGAYDDIRHDAKQAEKG